MRTGEIGRERGRRGDRESKMRISSIYPHRLHTALKAGTYRWHWATYGCLLKPLISLSLCTAPSVTCLRHPWVCASFTILSDSSTHAHTRTHTHTKERTYIQWMLKLSAIPSSDQIAGSALLLFLPSCISLFETSFSSVCCLQLIQNQVTADFAIHCKSASSLHFKDTFFTSLGSLRVLLLTTWI